MGAHGPHLRESLSTVGALVRLLTCVDPGVTPQSSRGGKTLGAVRALVRSLSCVRAHVLLQVVAVSEAPTADQAAFGSVVIVAQLVVSQTFLRQEALATFLTLIRFLVVHSLVIL